MKIVKREEMLQLEGYGLQPGKPIGYVIRARLERVLGTLRNSYEIIFALEGELHGASEQSMKFVAQAMQHYGIEMPKA